MSNGSEQASGRVSESSSDGTQAERARIWGPSLGVSMLAWGLLCLGPAAIAQTHCPSRGPGALGVRDAVSMFFAMNRPGPLLAGWALMLAAMMLPLLVEPIRHVRYASFRQRRNRATALFLIGYGSVWMAAGALLIPIAAVATMLVSDVHWWVVALVGGGLGLLWHASPAHQICLNRAHTQCSLAAFGLAAEWDVLRFGLERGGWCVGSCWALMLVPMLLPHGHTAAMWGMTVVMFSNHLAPPERPTWRLHGLAPLRRILVSRLRTPSLPKGAARAVST